MTDSSNDNPVSMQTMERAEELSKQYETIKDRTIDDNTVLGRLVDIDTSPANDNILVRVDIPASTTKEKFRFNKPKAWTSRFKFVRWIQYYGYDADSFPNMLDDGCEVKISYDDGEYELFIPHGDGNIATRFLKDITSRIMSVVNMYRESSKMQTYFSFWLFFGWAIAIITLVSGFFEMGYSETAKAGFVGVTLVCIMAIALAEEDFVKQ